ncbi:MAG: hypothetical protein H6606_04680 [Flavobacteriales bacterium]|nr:hypothetical protein [Flavobacteriales bacterium]
MNRKEFLSKSAGAFAALSVTSMLRAQSDSSGNIREFVHEIEWRSGSTTYLDKYTFRISNSAVSYGELDRVELEVSSGEKGGSFSSRKIGVYEAEVRKLKVLEEGTSVQLKCKPFSWVKGQSLMRDEPFGMIGEKKNFILVSITEQDNSDKNYIRVMDKKKRELAYVKEYVLETPDFEIDSSGCFLATASADHKGISRKSPEMKAMYRFHDEFVSRSEMGREMEKEYYRLAPIVVGLINRHPQKNEIMDRMYDDLFKPCVELIEANKQEEAFAYFASYSYALKDALNLE